MPVAFSSLSLEYVRVPVAAEDQGVAVDPTSNVVEFAFETFADDTEPSSFTAGDWETDPGPPAIYYARILIGPAGTIVLADGKYHIWIKITASPEIPVRRVGVLTIE